MDGDEMRTCAHELRRSDREMFSLNASAWRTSRVCKVRNKRALRKHVLSPPICTTYLQPNSIRYIVANHRRFRSIRSEQTIGLIANLSVHFTLECTQAAALYRFGRDRCLSEAVFSAKESPWVVRGGLGSWREGNGVSRFRR